MKKYVFLALCVTSSLYCAEQSRPLNLVTTQWNAQDYARGNFVQEQAFFDFLERYKVDLTGKDILDVGSGTGNISIRLAQIAHSVTGIDQCPNMVEYAKSKYQDTKNVSFLQAFAENYDSGKKHNGAIASFCLHWAQNKELALQNIARHLEPGSDFFFTLHAQENPEPLNLSVPKKMMLDSWIGPVIKPAVDSFFDDQAAAIGATYPTTEEWRSIIEKEFEIITLQEETSRVIMPDRESLENFQRPIVMSRPIVQKIPEMLHGWLFSLFIDKLTELMEKTTDGKFVEVITTTVVHARKK